MSDTLTAEFDQYAQDYDCALNQGLRISGEGKGYFARQRIAWLARRLQQIAAIPANILDYGCGTGSATPFFRELLPSIESVVGVDLSEQSLERARQNYGHLSAEFYRLDQHRPAGTMDLAFCNGVFHHIPPSERTDALRYVIGSLRPGGLFAFWENNPWNPGTRYIMSRVPFDKNAITISARQARTMLRSAGFEIVHVDHYFVFPRIARFFRPLEPHLTSLPIGAQYQVLCRKIH